MAVPYTFGSATTSIPLSQLDSNFATTITLGNTAIQLGNTVTTLNNMTMANVTVSSASTPVPEAAGGTGTTTGYYGFKNRIINGAIGISQRTAVNTNVAVGTGTSGTFAPDRFSSYTGTASLWNISQVSTSAYDFPYALRLQRIAAQTSTSAIYLRQLIETNNCIDLAGQSVALSFYATAGANYSGGAATVSVFTGTAADQGTTSLNTGAWTGAATPINSTFTPTTTRTKFTFTGTFGSTIQEVAFSISWAGSGTAGANDYIDITGVQLEKGSTATSFDYRPYSTELVLCQRYYEKSFDMGTAVAQNSGTYNGTSVFPSPGALSGMTFADTRYKVNKRTASTVTFYNPSAANAFARDQNANVDCTATSAWTAGESSFGISASTPVGSAAGNRIAVHWSASSEL